MFHSNKSSILNSKTFVSSNTRAQTKKRITNFEVNNVAESNGVEIPRLEIKEEVNIDGNKHSKKESNADVLEKSRRLDSKNEELVKVRNRTTTNSLCKKKEVPKTSNKILSEKEAGILKRNRKYHLRSESCLNPILKQKLRERSSVKKMLNAKYSPHVENQDSVQDALKGVEKDDMAYKLQRSESSLNSTLKQKLKERSSVKKMLNAKDSPHVENQDSLKDVLKEVEKDDMADKLQNIVIQTNFIESNNGCENIRKICTVSTWCVSSDMPENKQTVSENCFKGLDDMESNDQNWKQLSGSKFNSRTHTDVESTTTTMTTSNLTDLSNCDLCTIKNHVNNNDDFANNPFANYCLEACDFNIKITKTVEEKSTSAIPQYNKKLWTNVFEFKNDELIRITSIDSVFTCAVLENCNDTNINICPSIVGSDITTPSLLPPAKRPPTRRFLNNKKAKNDDEDAISIYAGSVISHSDWFQDYCKLNDTKDLGFSYDKHQETRNAKSSVSACNNTDEVNIQNCSKKIKSYNREKIQNGEKNFNLQAIASPQFPNVPEIFRGLCFNHFLNKNCKRLYCPQLHTLHANIEDKVLNLSYEVLEEAYRFCKNKYLYKEMFPYFINAYVKYRKVSNIVSMIPDIFKQDMFERSPFVEEILRGIQNVGFSFHRSVEEVIKILDLTNMEEDNLCLADILINIIVRSSENLEYDWPLLQTLTKNRTEKLDHGVVEDILRICNEFKSKKLCCHAFWDVVNNKIVDIQSLDINLIKKFSTTLKSLNCFNEMNILLKMANIRENDSSSKYQYGARNDMPEMEMNHLQEEGYLSSVGFSDNEHLHLNGSGFEMVNKHINENSNLYFSDLHESLIETNKPENPSVSVSEVSSSKKTFPASKVSFLAKVIHNKDVSKFLGILEEFKAEEYVESFVLNVIMLWQKESLPEVYKMISKMLNTILIEKNKNRFWYDPYARSLIETLALNSLALFHEKKLWKSAAHIIKKFSNDYSNFVKAQCTRFHKYKYSELGKYLYCCKIFIRADYLQDAYDLLTDSKLQLLSESTLWTLEHQSAFDSDFRNDVINQFLKRSTSKDLNLSKKMILRIIKDQNCIISVDIWRYCNDILVALIDKHIYEDVLHILDEILNECLLKLRKEVFRSLLIVFLRTPDTDPLKLMKLYVCACKQGYYKNYDGTENEVILKTDMLYEEIYLILHVFFYRKATSDILVLADLYLKLQLPEVVDDRPHILMNSNVSINDFRIKIYRVLALAFLHPVCVEDTKDKPCVVIKKEQLEIFLRFYKNQNNFIL